MNYSKFFRENAGKDVEVIMTDGEKIEGKLSGYISAEDNDPEPESIIPKTTEIYTNEISKARILK